LWKNQSLSIITATRSVVFDVFSFLLRSRAGICALKLKRVLANKLNQQNAAFAVQDM
jgi:hypothetical protein